MTLLNVDKRKTYTNIPLHVIEEMYNIGYGRQLCLYASLKQIYRNGTFYKYKSLDLKNVGFNVSRKTYVKYVIQLKKLGLIRGENKKGKPVMRLISQKELLKLYPKKKALFIKFENNTQLHKNYEKLIIERNLYKQLKKTQKRICNPEFMETSNIIKTVQKNRFVENKSIEQDLSLSCKSVAKLIGKRSGATGSKRERKWKDEGFINITKRKICLGKITQDMYNFRKRSIAEGGQGQNIYRMPSKYVYLTLANEIEIRNSIFLNKKPNYATM